ncbi:peptidylprolyl isomerase [Leptolyngbya sp. FACHB-261]|uniref:peptidylprolyl isomerase n=1 Tax=Leptolyngbya sp. FACHB-261 TaxID=2692806 RepID=UPI001681F169|nr:peptidylprolyl isomerase [Leptolyngbya sp. FACHB-261]MBD2100847.1 peptidylprolyl isomerase [Leptolyngbya sp. FACHB-261]
MMTVTNQMIPLLASYRMLPQLFRELCIDRAIANIDCTPEEIANACQQFNEQNQLESETARQAWLEQHCLTLEQLETLATRNLRIEKFKQVTWGHRLESYFLQRRQDFDQVIYSLIRTRDPGVAHELYFRIQAGEQTFAELARQYSEGPEAETGGINGPGELKALPAVLARVLSVSRPGQLWLPFRLAEWFVVVRLEKLVRARLDETMRQRLLDELFENWLQEQLQQTGPEALVQLAA